MKKLNLSLIDFQVNEILTRDQLKNILGGDPPASSAGNCNYGMNCGVYVGAGDIRYGQCNDNWGGGSGQVMGCSCETTFGVYTPATTSVCVP